MKKTSVFLIILITVLVGFLTFVCIGVKGKISQNSISGTTVSAEKSKDTHIFMCADDGNAMPTCVTIASVLKNSLENEKINIHIVSFEDNHMSDENVKKIKSLSNSIKDFNLDFTYFDKKRLDEFNTEYWNKSIMVKLFAAELFPNLERVVWLDDDVIVLRSLNEVFTKDFGDKCLGGVDVAYEYKIHHERNLPYWITAGFGVYNIKEMRKQNTQELLLNNARNYKPGAYDRGECCEGIEEYALTKVPKDKMLVFPYKYSVMCSAFGKDSYKNLALDDCVVLHFAGTPKPWRQQDHIGKKFADTWNKYYNMTPYAQQEKKAA